MIKVVCIKEIPFLCQKGEVGFISLSIRTRIINSWSSWSPYLEEWLTVEKLPDLLTFHFKNLFDEEDILRTNGIYIKLEDYFVKVNEKAKTETKIVEKL